MYLLTCCFSADIVAAAVSGLTRGMSPGGGPPEAELSFLIRGGSLSPLSPASVSDMLATSSPSAREPRPENNYKLLLHFKSLNH